MGTSPALETSKSGKTFLKSAIEATYLGGNSGKVSKYESTTTI
jgi:hypothetical protein